MKANYQAALAAVLKHEGGFADHPDDPGGATMRGVTQAVYNAYRQRLGLGTRSVRMIADDELQAIYRKQYWDVIHGDELPSGIDYAVFDFAVNSGPGRAVKYLQMVLGVEADGNLGQVTLRACEESDPLIAINGLCDKRLAFLKGLKIWATFGRGWADRVAGVRKLAIALAGKPVEAAPDAVAPDMPEKTDAPPAPPVADKSNGAAMLIGALIAAIMAILAWFGVSTGN